MKKTILSIIMIMAVGLGLTAQENNDTATRELSKKEQKALEKKKKQKEDSIAHVEAVEAIKNGVYILFVDKTMGRKVYDDSRHLNFVIVENGKILIQTGSATSYSGNNNLGGITVMSEIVGDVKLEEKKNGEVKSSFKVVDNFLSGNVNVKLHKKGNYGEVSILHMKTGDHIVFFGNIVPFTPELASSGAIEVGRLFVSQGWDAFSLGKKHDVGSLMDYLSGAR